MKTLLQITVAVIMLVAASVLLRMPLPEPVPVEHKAMPSDPPKPLPGAIGADSPHESPLAGSGEGTTDPAQGMAYVEANMARAKAGDHRVQYHVGVIASKCEAVYHNYLAGSELDPEASDWIFCGSFEHDPMEGTTGQYWIDRALEGQDLLAMLETANVRYLTERGTLEELQAAVTRAEQSDDPEVLAFLDTLSWR